MARSVIGALRVTLGLDSAEFETGIKRASKSTQQFTRAAKDVSSASNLISTSLRGVGAAIGIASVGAAAQQYLKLADASKQMAAQLRLATQGFGSFSQAQQDVQRIAGATRNGLAETAGLYGNFARATKELGGQQFEAARATETFAKTLKISGATQAEASAATTQFGQALASGVLRGDEFNSIMESSPRLARLLADSLNIPIGQLRAMAEDGKLTSDVLFSALTDRKFTESIDAEFRQMPVTFDEAMGQIYNSAVVSFGAFDRGGQFSSMIANFASDGASEFSNLESAAESFGITTRQQLNAIVEATKPVIDALAGIRSALAGAQNIIPQSAKISPEGAASALDSVTSLWRRPQAFGKGLWSAMNGGTFRQGFDDFMNGSSAAGLVRQVNGNIDKANTAAVMARIWAGNPLADAPAVPSALKPSGPAGTSKKSGGAKGPSEETLRKRAQREAERAADALRRFADDVDRENSDLTTTLADLSGTVEARRDADLQHIETERQVRERAINDDEMIDAAKKQQLIELNNQNADARKRLARQRAEDEIRDRQIRADQVRSQLSIELMQYSADAARTARERRAVELRILEAQFAEEENRLRLEALSSDLEKASEARLRLAQLPALRTAATGQLMRDTQGPLEAYLDRIPKSADEAREALERVQVDGIDGLIDGLAGVATGARSLGDVFKAVANQIIADIIRINLQRMLVGSSGGLLGSLIGGVGSVLGAGNPLAGSIATANANVANMASALAIPRNLPGFATGGSFRVGGSSSVGDQELVAFRANRGEIVDIRKPGNDNGGGGIAHVVPSPYFDVVVDNRAAQVAGPMSTQAAVSGSMGAQTAIAKRSARAYP
jgi:tape measure domain-containing protein